MNSSLLELCNLVTDEGAKYAHQYKELFLRILNEVTDKTISDEQNNAVYRPLGRSCAFIYFEAERRVAFSPDSKPNYLAYSSLNPPPSYHP